MDFSHRLHAVLPSSGGLQLWIEHVAEHRALASVADVEKGGLPDVCLEVLDGRALRSRGPVAVSTPKGRVLQLPIAVAAYTPDQAIEVLGVLSAYVAEVQRAEEGSASGVVPGLSPEVVFLCDVLRFVDECVRAGRVMPRTARLDDQWYPRWSLSTVGDHDPIFLRLQKATPEVLIRNGGDDVLETFVDELVHWLCIRYLQRDLPTDEVTTSFVSHLVSGTPARRIGAESVVYFDHWRSAARAEASRPVFVFSSPDDAITPDGLDVDDVAPGELSWRLEIAMSVNDGPIAPIVVAEASEDTKAILRQALFIACQVWSPLRDRMGAISAWLETGVWFPPPDVVTGDPDKDRVLSIGMDLEMVENFLSAGVPAIQNAGLRVMVPRAWVRSKSEVTVKARMLGRGEGDSKVGLDQLMDFSWDVSVDGEPVEESLRQELLDSAMKMVRLNGSFVFVDNSALAGARAWFRQLKQAKEDRALLPDGLFDAADPEEMGEGDGTGFGLVTLRDILEADALSAAEDTNHERDFTLVVDGWASRILGDGPQIDPPKSVDVPATVITPLRDHQRRGLNWLAWMHEHGLGGILADDMGLGKTLQVLALLAWERQFGEKVAPTLVVAPTSVVQAWGDEATRHVPSLRVHIDHGSQRPDLKTFAAMVDGATADEGEDPRAVDVVVTTYGTLQRNPERYWAFTWGRIVADEAQAIKNPDTKQSRAVRSIPAEHHLALTGTPVENRLSDLYAIMDFANPGILGTYSAFHNRLAVPIERHGDDYARERLQRLVQPFILRRLKTDEAMGLNLPAKNTIVEKVPLSREQAALYEAYVHDLERKLAEAAANNRRGSILGALVRFKQICDHPALFASDGSPVLKNGQHRSKKVERIFEIVAEALASGRRVLLFTQFPSFGRLLTPMLEEQCGVEIPMLHGGLTRAQRTRLVEEFQRDEGPPVMILSVRAGGTGITLTKASVVVHMDRWWNPAVEDQATDRAFRIGQTEDVTVYKMVAQGTIDERIHDIISGKRELAGDVIGMGEGWIANLDDDDLSELWHLRRTSMEED